MAVPPADVFCVFVSDCFPNSEKRGCCLITLHTLASGSSGNALLLSCGETHLLVDAGISCRRITAGLRELGLTPTDLHTILITHTHGDHISGLPVLLKHTACPVRALPRTCRELEYRLADSVSSRLLPLEPCSAEWIEGCAVTAIPVSHDAPGACGYRLDTEEGSVGVLTDTGFITDEAMECLPGVDLAVLEVNHDVEYLRSGPYPYSLKQRVLGPAGHLCNEEAARFAVTLAEAGAGEIVLAHLSRENNTPAMAQHTVETALSAAGLHPAVSVAPRDCLSRGYTVVRRVVCRK